MDERIRSVVEPETYTRPQEPPEFLLPQSVQSTKVHCSKWQGPAFVCLAWAIIESQYHAADTVKFDSVIYAGSVEGWNSTWVSCDSALDNQSTVQETWASFQQRISRDGNNRKHEIACSSGQTLLMIYDNINAAKKGISDELLRQDLLCAADKYTMTISCGLEDSACWIDIAKHHSSIIENSQCNRILRQFSYIMQQIQERPYSRITDLSLANPEDIAEIMSWNREPPHAVESCVHMIIQHRATERPQSVAVSSWDGEFTYSTLITLASQLANHLLDLGTCQESLIPLCFSKSKWTVVAMLGVSMAGGAFVPLEPTYPLSRLGDICAKVDPPLIICSSDNVAIARHLAPAIVILDDAHIDSIRNEQAAPSSSSSQQRRLPEVSPSNALFIIFTSGSSGIPKGAIVEHRSYCTTALAYTTQYGLSPSSRMIQFASYAFDMSIMEILSALLVGGCVCILPESDRIDNYIESAKKYHPTHILTTPSFLRTLSRAGLAQLPLKTLVTAGERLDPQDMACVLPDGVRLMNAYGPSECTPIVSVQTDVRRACTASNIGHPSGATFWVVCPCDPQRLAPVGAVGELLVEGACVGRGYLNNEAQTRAAFIDPPGWLVEVRHGHPSRVYRTGDLVQWQPDGSWVYIGRKDNQIKIHGQRVELGHIESHARRLFPDALDVVAEVVSPPGGDSGVGSRARIVLFVLGPEADVQTVQGTPFAMPTDRFIAASQMARRQLRESLPRHMVPSLFVPLAKVPRTASRKTDRRALRERLERYISTGGLEELSAHAPIAEEDQPVTDIQKALQEIWAGILRLPRASIGLSHNFFELGGDSLAAIQVAAAARSSGIRITVKDTFAHPVLSAMASAASSLPLQAEGSDAPTGEGFRGDVEDSE
ncbi:hypothetical protein FE257_008913 [Aspergillus nanangensis]|uniref:Carrier domain-containing protein n=1 Tax=Aspergillus nanangensis TaxID=2582783 RepID=A0AAD4CYB7_ASPNN|nr:hypothetical protein FE257_008913 [Aspergillus nanangensis]